MDKAVVLLSGGLDSATLLYFARKKYKPYCLIFDYGQRHRKETVCARTIARCSGSDFKLVRISLPWKGSSLLDKNMKLPKNRRVRGKEIPSTYVPARNIIFLSFASSYAEAVGAGAVFIGANAIDYSGYPDCRPEFFRAFQRVMKKGMKAGVEGRKIQILAPLLYKTKEQIVRLGLKLKVPFELTWSCYQGGKKPCGKCDSCILGEKGFQRAGSRDPK